MVSTHPLTPLSALLLGDGKAPRMEWLDVLGGTLLYMLIANMVYMILDDLLKNTRTPYQVGLAAMLWPLSIFYLLRALWKDQL